MHKLVGALVVAAVAFTAVPASAKSKMASCTEASMAAGDAKIMKLPDGDNKTGAMQEMDSAKSSMSQKDMAGCSDHMGKAMKMASMKSKKM